MNNKRYTYSMFLLLLALILFSCSQEELSEVAGGADASGIVLRVALPDAVTRSNNTTVTGDLYSGFHVSAICPEDDAAAGNALSPYFTEQFATQLEGMSGYFGMFDQSSEQWVWPTTRHGKQGRLRFFAFYPSREVMRVCAGVGSEHFGLKNQSTKKGLTVAYNYRMEKFKINTDIPQHIDFVTATAEGSRRANGETGMKLDFEHQLSRITLKAWGNLLNHSDVADIEIAGVRIGCAIVESDFDFAAKPTNYANGDATLSGNWVAPQKKDCVEYIFREGDTVIKLGGDNYKTAATATSIMGNGGWAMVIPTDNTIWNYKTDSKNSTQGLYFSVLLRVKEKDRNNTLLYPYIEGADLSSSATTDKMNVIYFSVDKVTGKVMKRLYKNKEDRKFYTDPDFSKAYTLPETEEIKNYGWAAIPLTTKLRWKPGYQYTYTLDYSDGVGVEDPDDLYPGKPIISKILVSVTEGASIWPKVDDFERGDEVDITDNITIK